ncbi:MAG: ATP-binding protein [Pyrinomonadaceae bacterium]
MALIGLAFLLLFRFFVDRPVTRLLDAMRRAEAGDFEAAATGGGAANPHDELGRLAAGYNRMIGRVREMTEERERQHAILKERVRDATRELSERNDELEAANDNLEAASQELWQTARRLTQLERLAAAEQTAAQFAHEVGTPLNLISGHIQLLQMKCTDDEQRAAARLDLVSEQIERISGIVHRMLDRTRPEAVAHTTLDLASLLRRTCDALLPTIEAHRVCLIDEVGVLPPINGDADRLQQVVINLTNNALDAMPEGGIFRISAKAAPSSVIVEFADTGTGMTPEVRARIFDPLYTTKERGRGTGLGLVVVRQVMREHGGEVEVASETGKGTEFRLLFPIAEESINHAK